MIREETIQAIRGKMDTREVLEDLGVTFKKDVACCPFHNEKTGSFHVWKRNDRYKCFGCGETGDAITAVMKLKQLNYAEALEWLAAKYNVTVEYDQAAAEESAEKKEAKQVQLELLEYARQQWEKCLFSLPQDSTVWQYLLARGYTSEICREWNIGYAPEDFKFLTTPIINMGKYQPGIDVGLISSKEGKNWDFFHNRIMIPIYGSTGLISGFGGRIVGDGEPKYLNSKESDAYSKSFTWFGLDRAYKAIKQAGFAYVTEGYFDCMSWHLAGITNTVAGCGTEINESQIKKLSRVTEHVVLALDGDKPGQKKSMKLVDLFLSQNFKVEIVPLPNGMDPDEYKTQFFTTNIQTNEEEKTEAA